MYKRNNNNNRRNGSRSGNRGGFSGRRDRQPKLHTSQLIKKSSPIQEGEEYTPINRFEDLQIDSRLKESIRIRGFTTPTPIQDQAIPHILEGKDLIGLAHTGTGKTGAFLIPIINKILLNPAEKALIIVPTRELAIQIRDDLLAFTSKINVRGALCIGGANMYRQKEVLARSPSIVIGTPGRLKDFIQQGVFRNTVFNTLVLDEVDRMLDMGFINDVKMIISKLPAGRQLLCFSATLPPQVQDIIRPMVHDAVTVSVKSQDASANVDQDVIYTNGRNKLDVLHDLLIQTEFDKVLVFGRTKWGIEKLTKQLEEKGLKVGALHGNKSQSQRQRTLEQFRFNRISVLLATDVASRGLDIADITHVINYDLPETYEDYIHRIGRTGRASKKGIALSFVN